MTRASLKKIIIKLKLAPIMHSVMTSLLRTCCKMADSDSSQAGKIASSDVLSTPVTGVSLPGGSRDGRVPNRTCQVDEMEQCVPLQAKRLRQERSPGGDNWAPRGGNAVVGFDDVSLGQFSDDEDMHRGAGSISETPPSGEMPILQDSTLPQDLPTRKTMTSKDIQLADRTMFDPMRLLSEAQEGMLQYEQRQFLVKYFYDPQFLPVVLEQLEDEHSISDSMKRAVGRPLDPEILDMMKPPNNTRAKELDKGFLSASHRLGIALGPLLQLWSLGREA